VTSGSTSGRSSRSTSRRGISRCDGEEAGQHAADPRAQGYDIFYDLKELERAKIYDTIDRNQTGLLIYTLTPGVKLAAAWGQDPLTATASGGATVQYRVLPDGYAEPLCVLTGNALAVSQPDGLPRDCVVEAYVDASSRYEAAVAQATFVINPTVVEFTGQSGPDIGPSSASVSVTLNRVWDIEYSSDCGSASANPASGASSYTVTVQFDDPNLTRPFSCSLTVSTSQPDGAVTTDERSFAIDVQ
jgi:hypothetical protein